MKRQESPSFFSPYRLWSALPRIEVSVIPDLLMFGAGLATFYGIVLVGRSWLGAFTPEVEISRSPLALPAYA